MKSNHTFSLIEKIAYTSCALGSLCIVSTLFLNGDKEMIGNVGIGLISIGLIVYLLGNKTKDSEEASS